MIKLTVKVVSLIFFLAIVLVVISLSTKEYNVKEIVTEYVFSKNVEEYRPVVEKHAEIHEVEEHVDVLLAMMMQESGGRGDDPMQSSESLCGEIGCIDDPEKSISQGVTYFAKALLLAEGDLKLAVQSYNFGLGFVNYVKSDTKKYSEGIAIEFSKKMYDDAEDQSIYTCLRKEAKELDACYGDIHYVRDVMSFKQKFAVK